MAEPVGELLARGRTADVYDLGDAVLRRRRDGRSSEDEAAVMTWAAAHGVSTPRVWECRGPDMVMEKVRGPTLLESMPDAASAASAGRLLAKLHGQLDSVPAPNGLHTTYGVDEGLLHGDLHPGNVLLGEAGPVLIDWTNASTGVRAADVADTWTLVSCFEPGNSHVEALRAPLLDAFLHDVDVAAARPWLENVARQRLGDPNTSSLEAARIKLLCRQNRDEKA